MDIYEGGGASHRDLAKPSVHVVRQGGNPGPIACFASCRENGPSPNTISAARFRAARAMPPGSADVGVFDSTFGYVTSNTTRQVRTGRNRVRVAGFSVDGDLEHRRRQRRAQALVVAQHYVVRVRWEDGCALEQARPQLLELGSRHCLGCTHSAIRGPTAICARRKS